MSNHFRIACGIIVVGLIISSASPALADTAITYNNFGSDGSSNFLYGNGTPPSGALIVGRPEIPQPPTPMPEIQWAMSFVAEQSGLVSDIYVGAVHCPSAEGVNNISIAIHKDELENGIHRPEWWIHGSWYFGEGSGDPPALLPVCQECPNEGPCSPNPTGSVLHGSNLSDWGVFLEQGQRYWIVLSEPYPAVGIDMSRWHLNSINNTGYRASRNIAETAAWNTESAVPLGAFRIDVLTSFQGCGGDMIPFNEDCGLDPFLPEHSRCWLSGMGIHAAYPRDGFPLNINLWQGFGPSDFPPVSNDPALSTSPLVSNETLHFGGRSAYRERPMHNGVIDLITGQALLQATDFELPFGGATFRHVRTYSENTSQFFLQGQTGMGISGQPAEGTFWDWNGLFWMMGENPILLIDASYKDFQGNAIITPDEKRCYLIPDAHHAIPFMYSDGQYTAPPWFDAVLLPGPVIPGTARPAEYYAYLHNKSVKYTFEARYEDLWNVQWGEPPQTVSVHEPGVFQNQSWAGGGLGLPYYGLVKRIEDRYGNKIEYTYCDHYQFPCDNPPVPPGCRSCCQNCNEKGQIKSIRLVAASGQVVWTLLYSHREFQSLPRLFYGGSHAHMLYMPHALHTIHVYEGDVADPPDCLTLPYHWFCRNSDLGHVENLDALDALNHYEIDERPNWVIEARYLYSEPGYVGEEALCPSTNLFGESSVVLHNLVGVPDTRIGRRLLKVTVTRRDPLDAEAPVDKRVTLYRDGPIPPGGGADKNAESYLKYVYENSTVKSILESDPESGGNPNYLIQLQLPPEQFAAHGLATRADLEMTDYGNDQYVPLPAGTTYEEFFHEFITFFGGDVGRTRFIPGQGGRHSARHSLIDRRASSRNNGETRYYYLVKYPSTTPDIYPPPNGATWPPAPNYGGIIYHFPFQFYHPFSGETGDFTLHTSALGEPFFITVVDELIEGEEYEPHTPKGLRTRRVVEMNPAGFVIADRTWSFENSTGGVIVGSIGQAERYRYDCKGRILQRRTVGWEAPGSDPETEGLIYVYKYPDPCCAWEDDACNCNGMQCMLSPQRPGQVEAEGIKRGTGTTPEDGVYYIRRFERHPDRPDLITKEINYPLPNSNPTSADGEVTETTYTFDEASNPDPSLRRMTSHAVVRPPTAREPGGPPVYPVAISQFDVNGNLEWLGVGSLLNSSDPTTAIEFYVNHTARDALGRVVSEEVDLETAPGAPNGWQHVGAVPALNLITAYDYEHPTYGLTKITHPNSRQTRIGYVQNPTTGEIDQWTFKDIRVLSNGSFEILSPATIRHFEGGRVVKEDKVKITSISGDPDGYEDSYEIISTSTPQFDANGRVIGAELSGGGADTISGAIAYNGFGSISRQRDPDGTITRFDYDALGRLFRTFKGTNDTHEYWGTAVVCNPCPNPNPPNPPDCYDAGTFPDNMTLVEKRYYGTGATNADQLVQVRSYRDMPVNQYFEQPWTPPCEMPPTNPPDNNENDIGWITSTEYDWRKRPVWVRSENSSHAAITHTLTWYDNLDRVRFTAEYGATAPDASSIDPRDAIPGQSPPTAAQILQDSPRPRALSETNYNTRGLPEEIRGYNVSVLAGSSYTRTRTFYDHGDRSIEVHAPNSPIQRYVYDAKGRQVIASSLSLDGMTEIARTRNVFDTNDRATIRYKLERRHDAAAGSLNDLSQSSATT